MKLIILITMVTLSLNAAALSKAERIDQLTKIAKNVDTGETTVTSFTIEDDGCTISLKGIGYTHTAFYNVSGDIIYPEDQEYFSREDMFGQYTAKFEFKAGIGWLDPYGRSKFKFNTKTPGVTTNISVPFDEHSYFILGSSENSENVRSAFSALHKECYVSN
jgi:hypothetical protein